MKNEDFQIHDTFAQTSLKLFNYQSYQYVGVIMCYLMIYSTYWSLGKQLIHTFWKRAPKFTPQPLASILNTIIEKHWNKKSNNVCNEFPLHSPLQFIEDTCTRAYIYNHCSKMETVTRLHWKKRKLYDIVPKEKLQSKYSYMKGLLWFVHSTLYLKASLFLVRIFNLLEISILMQHVNLVPLFHPGISQWLSLIVSHKGGRSYGQTMRYGWPLDEDYDDEILCGLEDRCSPSSSVVAKDGLLVHLGRHSDFGATADSQAPLGQSRDVPLKASNNILYQGKQITWFRKVTCCPTNTILESNRIWASCHSQNSLDPT